jgi:phospholipase C
MSTFRSILGSFSCLVLFLGLCGMSCIAGAATSVQLTVKNAGAGAGAGRVISTPAGIDCPGRCTASFPAGTTVVLTPAPEPGITFAGWSGPCTGMGTCKLTLGESTTAAPTFEIGTANLASINHIVFLAQENRSLDNYFGAMRQYWKLHGIPDQSFDGLPQFNPTSGAPPLFKAPPALPGCNPANPPPSDCVWDPTHTVASFHMKSVCNENTSPSWNEAHVDWNFNDQVGRFPAKNNGFVKTAGHDARTNPGHPFFDVNGKRAMGYWDGTDLNYYYFMATNFATSDRFFHPVMARTEPNREYLVAATSGGYALPNGSNANDTAQLKAKPIFAALQQAGISWKVYVNPQGTGCAGPPYQPSCLIKHSYLSGFGYAQTILAQSPQKIAPISQYFLDLQNGTLPQVAEIAPASDAGLDEHGSVTDRVGTNVQKGARYTSTLINALMGSSSWSSSVFILTFDESGGMYDHVPPQPAVSPDGIAPVDIPPNSVCYTVKGPTCNFVFTGYRIPLIVVSPFAKKNYVSHTVADSTAILKFIETRFNLPPLTKRDAAQMDMAEFFNFNSPPWMSPPSPPAQNLSNPCYLDRVP